MKDRLAWIDQDMNTLREEGLFNNIRTLASPQGAWLIIDGRRVLNMCSNNYLGLADHPFIKEKIVASIEKFGVGPGAVRAIAGTNVLHIELERRIAEFKGEEAALSFQSGFTSNLGTIPALVGKEDIIFSDELNHASIIDGCRLSRAKIVRYSHCNMDHLKEQIREKRNSGHRAIIITDGVFSMDGDIAPLADLSEIAHNSDCLLMVDDAHGEGVLGRGGRGIVDHFHLHGKVDIEVGTFSKAFGVMGGAVVSNSTVIEWLKQQARPFLFSSALTVPDVAACIASIELLEQSDDLVVKLWENTRYFQGKLRDLGFNIGITETPITPILCGETSVARALSNKLFQNGIFASALGYPTVPRGKARIRVIISADHSRDDLALALDMFKKLGCEFGILK